jgi:hypothetical protein
LSGNLISPKWVIPIAFWISTTIAILLPIWGIIKCWKTRNNKKGDKHKWRTDKQRRNMTWGYGSDKCTITKFPLVRIGKGLEVNISEPPGQFCRGSHKKEWITALSYSRDNAEEDRGQDDSSSTSAENSEDDVRSITLTTERTSTSPAAKNRRWQKSRDWNKEHGNT